MEVAIRILREYSFFARTDKANVTRDHYSHLVVKVYMISLFLTMRESNRHQSTHSSRGLIKFTTRARLTMRTKTQTLTNNSFGLNKCKLKTKGQ